MSTPASAIGSLTRTRVTRECPGTRRARARRRRLARSPPPPRRGRAQTALQAEPIAAAAWLLPGRTDQEYFPSCGKARAQPTLGLAADPGARTRARRKAVRPPRPADH